MGVPAHDRSRPWWLSPETGPACAPEALTPQQRRAVTALLRGRARRLPELLGPERSSAARALPMLLHVSFERRPLDGEAPGVTGLQFRTGWTALARDLGLPPPCRAQRERCLLEAVLAIPSAAALDVIAIVRRPASVEELGRAQERLDVVRSVLAKRGVAIRMVLFDAARLRRDREACQRALAFGALLGGEISPVTWAVLEASRLPVPARVAAALAAQAPTPLATAALTLLTRGAGPGPLEAALELLARGASARQLADTDLFAVRWAGLATGRGELLEDVHRAIRETPSVRPLDELLSLGRDLASACVAALHLSRLGRAGGAPRQLWREAVESGLPRALLPAVGAALTAEAGGGPLPLEPARAGRAFEVRVRGALLGRGAGPVQARVRALALIAAAGSARSRQTPSPAAGAVTPVAAGLGSPWTELAQRLTAPPPEDALLLMISAGGAVRPGPPVDLLNRGPERAMEFEGALSVRRTSGRRPSGRVLSPAETVAAVVRAAACGTEIDIVPIDPAGRPLAARLARVSELLRDPLVATPVAVEAGGRVLLAHGRRIRTFSLHAFARRPRRCTPDPEAADLSAGEERRGVPARARGVLRCRASLSSATTAALLYTDAAGRLLREEVPLTQVEARLGEARAILGTAAPRAVLALQVSEELASALRRVQPISAPLRVLVRGDLPWIEVEVHGERFGGPSAPGFDAAARALRASAPAVGGAAVAVAGVSVTACRDPAPPLLALYAGTLARRRLRTHLLRCDAHYRAAGAGRREG